MRRISPLACNSDLNAHNILRQDKGNLGLIDFDKCAEKAGDSWKAQNLERLLHSLQKEVGRIQIQFQPEN